MKAVLRSERGWRRPRENTVLTAEVSEVTTDGDRARVAAIVSGNFPGSPVTLRFTFTIDKDRIERLDIGA